MWRPSWEGIQHKAVGKRQDIPLSSPKQRPSFLTRVSQGPVVLTTKHRVQCVYTSPRLVYIQWPWGRMGHFTFPSSQCNIPKGFPSLLCFLGRSMTVVPRSPSKSAFTERDPESAIHSKEVQVASPGDFLQLNVFR